MTKDTRKYPCSTCEGSTIGLSSPPQCEACRTPEKETVQAIASGSAKAFLKKPILSIEREELKRGNLLVGKVERVEVLDGETLSVDIRIKDKKTLKEIQTGKHPFISIGSNLEESNGVGEQSIE